MGGYQGEERVVGKVHKEEAEARDEPEGKKMGGESEDLTHILKHSECLIKL